MRKQSGETQRWTYDGRCGAEFPLPDDTPSQCDPDGKTPCCSHELYGNCGNSTEHCTCEHCTDYRIVYREWRESQGKQKWRSDKKCGFDNPLPDGTPAQCDPDGENPCCNNNYQGKCGNTTDHCTCEFCTNFNILYKEWRDSHEKQKWRYDKKCGSDYPLPDGTPAQCDPDGENPCCNNDEEGSCGNEHCNCDDCTDYRIVYRDWKESGGTQKWRSDKKCGSKIPLPDGTAAECDPDGNSPCCDDDWNGKCGNTAEHCSCKKCKDFKLLKDWTESGGTQKWRYDGTCGGNSPLPDKTPSQCDPEGENPCCSDLTIGKCSNTTEHCTCDGWYECIDYRIVYRDWRESGGTKKWRSDKKCGSMVPLLDGTPAECDPDGDSPCCDDDGNGKCGNTAEQCTCKKCKDYKFLKDLEESGGKLKWRRDGKCGSEYPLPDGTYSECDPDRENPCCSNSRDGHCGNTEEHCNCDECKDFKLLKLWEDSGRTLKWRYDGRCGSDYPLPDGSTSQCNHEGENPCCNGLSFCGNTPVDCTCEECTDYRIVYKEWEDSEGKQKWRYDNKCGYGNPLPDGTPAQCDPDGENPCCNQDLHGKCGSTTDHCFCEDCIDYRHIDKEWKESGKKQRWRYDGRCGKNYPLPDGTASECDPSSEIPCCNGEYSKCDNDKNACLRYIDYRAVKEVRESGENCSVARLSSGFLKIACLNEALPKMYFKCAHSESFYEYNKLSNNGDVFSVSNICENDPHAYQACGINMQNQSSSTPDSGGLCEGFFCEKKKWADEKGVAGYVKCTGDRDGCEAENSQCYISEYREDTRCDDKCDKKDCEDESSCNGHKYGIKCAANSQWDYYIRAQAVCDKENNCDLGTDEEKCSLTERGALQTCIHYRLNVFGRETHIVPIHNYTRCSVLDIPRGIYPYCSNYLDQTNCSDIERVGGYCKVNGSMSTISKYMICKKYDLRTKLPIMLCDKNLQNKCYTFGDPITGCKIHKHRMCDGVEDCPDGGDELHGMCEIMTEEKTLCQRRFNLKGGEQRIPVSWIMDDEEDCMSGVDENTTFWEPRFCRGKTGQMKLNGTSCGDVYKCPGNKKSSVPLEKLCDGVDSCGDSAENKVCKVARDFPDLKNSASYNGSIQTVCNDSKSNCEIREFIRPWGDVFGARKELKVPTTKVRCSEKFGEEYLFLSCMDLCQSEEQIATCPLKGKSKRLEHDSCLKQYPHRTKTLGKNTFLTFLIKSDMSSRYHQDLYRCNNNRCVEYKQVCDLVDDCGDMSDEINCTNHLICNDTLNSTKHQFIALSQRCDGIYDCFDLSDECNDTCGREILGNWFIKIVCWFMGILALIFNLFTVINESLSLKDCETEQMMISKVLMSLIGSGDFLIGLYLIILSIYDSIVFGKEFCRSQAEWLSGTPCLTLGVISTLGSQVSLFTMTILSVIRMYGLTCAPMRVPAPVSRKSILKIASLVMMTTTAALMIAVTPLLPSLEDYFVQGMYYNSSYKVFIGFPNKEKHIRVLNAYDKLEGTEIADNLSASTITTWKKIGEKVDAMFSHEYGNLTRSPVHFYGNDGVCLYKYFVRTDDARRSRQPEENQTGFNGDPVVWTMLAVNLFCFIVITICYIVIICKTRQSSQRSGQQDNQERQKNERAIQNKIMIIITTDFLCWVPFIMISGLHNLEYINASKWYSSFAMIVLPFNSVINPLVYDKALGELIGRKFGWLKKAVRSCRSPIATAIGGSPRNGASEGIQEPEVTGVTAIELTER